MRELKRIVPFLLCFVLAVTILSAYSPALAADADQPPPTEEGGEEGDAPASTGMFETTASLGKALLTGIWSIFGIYVPGFSFTFGQMWLGVLLASISILVVRMIFGFGGSGSGGVSSRTSSTNNPKISKERRHDEF
ncbi:MAG: hypothetical protein HDT16_05590 [Oscillibacter sp.]|nr:hypothetical protein [Oscillibacter sp.]